MISISATKFSSVESLIDSLLPFLSIFYLQFPQQQTLSTSKYNETDRHKNKVLLLDEEEGGKFKRQQDEYFQALQEALSSTKTQLGNNNTKILAEENQITTILVHDEDELKIVRRSFSASSDVDDEGSENSAILFHPKSFVPQSVLVNLVVVDAISWIVAASKYFSSSDSIRDCLCRVFASNFIVNNNRKNTIFVLTRFDEIYDVFLKKELVVENNNNNNSDEENVSTTITTKQQKRQKRIRNDYCTAIAEFFLKNVNLIEEIVLHSAGSCFSHFFIVDPDSKQNVKQLGFAISKILLLLLSVQKKNNIDKSSSKDSTSQGSVMSKVKGLFT
jgi:hypothetical protein